MPKATGLSAIVDLSRGRSAFDRGRAGRPHRKGVPLQLVSRVEMVSGPAKNPNPWNLSAFDLSILDMMVQGMGRQAIAERTRLQPATVTAHLSAIRKAMGVVNNTQAVLAWYRHFRVLHPDAQLGNKDNSLIASLTKATKNKSWAKERK